MTSVELRFIERGGLTLSGVCEKMKIDWYEQVIGWRAAYFVYSNNIEVLSIVQILCDTASLFVSG